MWLPPMGCRRVSHGWRRRPSGGNRRGVSGHAGASASIIRPARSPSKAARAPRSGVTTLVDRPGDIDFPLPPLGGNTISKQRSLGGCCDRSPSAGASVPQRLNSITRTVKPSKFHNISIAQLLQHGCFVWIAEHAGAEVPSTSTRIEREPHSSGTARAHYRTSTLPVE
jgi:hypothetical protein